MYRLRLIKGLSYTGAVTATRDNPIVETDDKAAADSAVASGYFVLESAPEETETPATPEEISDIHTDKPISEMTKVELEQCAAYYNISTKGLTKAEIIAALKEALPVETAAGVIDYGSPTMVELQK